jgi:TRAP transporter 4TM/12TM fusion protein
MTDDNRLKESTVASEPAVETAGGITAEMQKELDEIMLKYDRESTYRRLSDYRGTIIAVIGILFSLIQLYHTFNPLPYIRPLHLGFVMLLAYLLYPAKKTMRKDTIPWYDIALAVIAFGVCIYQVINLKALNERLRLQDYERIMAIIGIVLLLEATRRVVGLPIVIIASTFILIALFGKHMPGFLKSNNSWKRIVEHLWYDQGGVFGTAIGACTTFIFLFMLFGAFLEKTGVGEFFIDLANAIAGASRGGPAKVAVISSALMGTVSGSSVANTVGTGSFTIPMMKKMGYRPQFAGAVEASASTGGQIMPPVMGAAAFLMVDSIGLPYAQIIKAAVIPAMLYFSGILLIIDLESKKHNLLGLSKDQLPKVRTLMAERGHLMAPLLIIIYVLVGTSLTPAFAALIGIAAAAVIGYVKTLMDLLVPNTKSIDTILAQRAGLKIKDYLECLETGARGVLSVALACATSGVVSGVITVTGIGARIGDGFAKLAGGHLMLLLFFTMITSIVLGMGVPTTANYIITSSVMAPVVIKAMAASLPEVVAGLEALGSGYMKLPAHMFTFYFGIVADITPPVCLAAMAGAAIAKADPIKTGFEATRLAIAAFLIPYMFIFSPQLLMVDAAWYDILRMMGTALIGMFGVAMFMQKFYLSKLNIIQQVMALAGGLMLIDPGLYTDMLGIGLVVLVVVWNRIQTKGKIIPIDNARPLTT